MLKKNIYLQLQKELGRRKSQLAEMLNDALESTAGETKSTAGDKHETARAMAQLEQEKIGSQLNELNKLSDVLHRIDPEKELSSVQLGSLVTTNNGNYYFSIALGQLTIDGQQIFCLSPGSPLGKMLLGKKKGDSVCWQGNDLKLLNVS
jgi:transcription elongation GreA/GreB family factor